MVLENKKLDAQKVMKLLADKHIGTRPFFYPMHLQPVFKKMGLFKNQKFPNAELLAKQGFYLPSGLGITERQIREVATTLKEILA